MSNRGDPEQTLHFGPRIQPTDYQIADIANQIKSLLFWNNVYVFGLDALRRLLNNVSKSKFAPTTGTDILYGECVMSMLTARKRLRIMGIRGGKLKQQQKEAITSALIRLRGHNKVDYNNKKLLKAILPHKSKWGRNQMIKKCIGIVTKFESDVRKKDLCLPHEKLTRNFFPRLVINSFMRKWSESTDPSPSRYDNRLLKIKGKTVKDDNGDRIKSQIHVHSQHMKDIYEEWTIEYKEDLDQLIEAGKLKKIPCINSFRNHRPSFVRKCPVINHMACDDCLGTQFVFESLIRVFSKCHSCSKDDDCYINILIGVDWWSRRTLAIFCCTANDTIFPSQFCANDRCEICGTKRLKELLHNFTGCNTLDISKMTSAEYVYKAIVKVGQSKKDNVCIAHLSMWFDEFRGLLIETLQHHIYHLFNWKKQEHEKESLTVIRNGKMKLLRNDLMISMDFITNYHIPAKNIPIGMGTQRVQIQIGVISEYRNVPDPNDGNDSLVKSAHIFLSDNTHHGWFSAIPMIDKYMAYRTKEIQSSENITIKRLLFWSDRGPKDFLTAPFVGHLPTVCGSYVISILMNTTGSNHGKDYHDQIGGTAVTFLDDAFCNDKIKLNRFQSIARQVKSFMTEKFAVSLDGKLKRTISWIPEDKIIHAESPVDRIITMEGKGITKYHSIFVTENQIWLRPNSCMCGDCLCDGWKCLSGGWKANVVCRNSEISGIWSPIKKSIDMPSYDTLQSKEPEKKRPRVPAQSVKEIFYCPYCPKPKPYKNKAWYDKHVAKYTKKNTNTTQQMYINSVS